MATKNYEVLSRVNTYPEAIKWLELRLGIKFDYAIEKNHLRRLFGKGEGPKNKVALRNYIDATYLVYLYDGTLLDNIRFFKSPESATNFKRMALAKIKERKEKKEKQGIKSSERERKLSSRFVQQNALKGRTL